MLRDAGYDTDRVTDEGLSGTADADLWPIVCCEGRFFITLDLDFSDVRHFVPGSHPGILLLRPVSQSRDAALAVLTRVLSEVSLPSLTGCLAIADERRTRIRRPYRVIAMFHIDNEKRLRSLPAFWFLNGGRCWGTLWVTPHSRKAVLQMFKYDGYAKDKDGNFTQSKFVEVSNKVAYTVE